MHFFRDVEHAQNVLFEIFQMFVTKLFLYTASSSSGPQVVATSSFRHSKTEWPVNQERRWPVPLYILTIGVTTLNIMLLTLLITIFKTNRYKNLVYTPGPV